MALAMRVGSGVTRRAQGMPEVLAVQGPVVQGLVVAGAAQAAGVSCFVNF